MRRFVILAVLLLAGVCSGCDREQEIQPSGKVVKVGVIGPFSGGKMALGTEAAKGIETAMVLNPLLGNGDAVELIEVDDQNDSTRTAEAIKQLAGDNDVAAILLLSTSGSALAAGAPADASAIPVLALLATHSDVTAERQYISQLCVDNTFQGSVAALFVRDELLLDRVAVISDPESFYSSQLAYEFVRKFRRIGGTITELRVVEDESGSYSGALRELQNRGTELLYLPLDAGEVIRIVKDAEVADWAPVMMGGDGLLSSALAQHPKDAGRLDGIYATDFYGDGMPLTEYGEDVVNTHRSLFDDPGTTYSVLGAEGFLVLYQAMNRCADPGDRSCVNRMIRNTRHLQGVTGRLSIGQDGKAVRPVAVNAIRDRYMEFIVKVY